MKHSYFILENLNPPVREPEVLDAETGRYILGLAPVGVLSDLIFTDLPCRALRFPGILDAFNFLSYVEGSGIKFKVTRVFFRNEEFLYSEDAT